MIVLVLGPDAATARAAVVALLREHDPAGTSTSQLDGRTTTVPEIIGQVGSLGFFGDRRVVVVHDLVARAGKPAKGNTAQDDSGDFVEPAAAIDLAPLFAAVPAQNVLILLDATVAAVPAAVKKALPADARVIPGEPPRGTALITWLVRRVEKEGSTVDQGTARYLAERLYPQTWANRPTNPQYDRPPDLDLFANEVAKLATAAGPGPITRRHVDALSPRVADDQLFRFADAAARGDLAPALVELAKLLAVGEEPFKLAAQVQGQLELAAVLETDCAPRDPAAAGKAIGLSNPNRMVGIAAARHGRSGPEARCLIAASTAVDRESKRGELRHGEDALYHLLFATALERGAGSADGGT